MSTKYPTTRTLRIYMFRFKHINTGSIKIIFAPNIEVAFEELSDMVPDFNLWKLL